MLDMRFKSTSAIPPGGVDSDAPTVSSTVIGNKKLASTATTAERKVPSR